MKKFHDEDKYKVPRVSAAVAQASVFFFMCLTAELFPRQTQKDKELLKILSGHTTSLRYGFVDDVPSHDYEVLNNRYYEFVERADKLAATELERLEKLNENTNQTT